jgi:pSer/pThr/pTyr-binding forkhead associated (FHA) protein
VPTASKLVLTLSSGQEQEFALAAASVTLGRATTNPVVLRDPKVSRSHARIEEEGDGFAIADLGSANGTYVNGARVERTRLNPGDVIKLGDSLLRFEIAPPRSEPDILQLDSVADLDATLSQATVSMTLRDTRVPRLVVHTAGKTWEVPIAQDVLAVGRDSGSDVFLDDPKVSRRHARIEQRGESFILRDLGSANGTWLGDKRVEEHTLQNGDVIRIGGARLIFKEPFGSDDLTLVETPTHAGKAARRPVVFVPGLSGSELWLGSERVWPNPRLLLTEPEIFRLPETKPLQARGVIGEVVIVPNFIKLEAYSRMGDYLEDGLGYERGKDLLEFGYDWRQDVRQSACRLGEAIENWSITPPVTIIAHSLGCLVSRYYVQRLGGHRKVKSLILMGGPQVGTPPALAQLILGPDMLPFGLLGDRLRQVAATFPSIYQILPTYACVFDQHAQPIDVFSDETWVSEAQRPLLRGAREFWQELGTRSRIPTVSIFGYGVRTVTKVTVQRDAQMCWKKLDLSAESNGDAAVPVQSAVLEGSEIHPVQQNHAVLFVDNDVKMRLKLELTR